MASKIGIFDNAAIQDLATTIEEAARSTEEGVKHFLEPAPGTLKRATSKRHHLIFGRRGSGKSSLLRKAGADLTVDRRPIAYVNLESFKEHSYPDVLLSVLLTTFENFKKWMESAAIHPASKTTFWNRLFGSKPKRQPYKRPAVSTLINNIDRAIKDLNTQLYSSDGADIEIKTGKLSSDEMKTSIKVGGSSVSAEVGGALSHSMHTEKSEKYRSVKVDFLFRNIIFYQKIFDEISSVSSGDSYIFLDDLYHIRRADQASLIDYFHRIAKDHHAWLKIGTIRHRSDWYRHGNPPIGLKLGDDADEIDLDLTLEKYVLAKHFLSSILENFAKIHGLKLTDFVTDAARDRLILASGGVARDFLAIFRRSIDIARQRVMEKKIARGEKIGVEDVNVAAGEYEPSKREDFKRDASEDKDVLTDFFNIIRDFCLTKAGANCFLLDKDAIGIEAQRIHELVDLKLLHVARSRVTVGKRPGKIFEAYMLDLSQYAGARKKRELEIIEFWRPNADETIRRIGLIFTPSTI